jgi:hypothetical protein
MKSKYNATIIKENGITFRSKKEHNRYKQLQILQKSGEIEFFIRQPKFDLPGGVTYSADFLVVWKDPYKISIEDVKGYQTKEFIFKKKILEALYPFKLVII